MRSVCLKRNTTRQNKSNIAMSKEDTTRKTTTELRVRMEMPPVQTFKTVQAIGEMVMLKQLVCEGQSRFSRGN